jgi:hypothetical protein
LMLKKKYSWKHTAVTWGAAVKNIKKGTSAKRKTNCSFCFLSCDVAITLWNY